MGSEGPLDLTPIFAVANQLTTAQILQPWTKDTFQMTVQFSVNGQGKSLFGDGFALWYTKGHGQLGMPRIPYSHHHHHHHHTLSLFSFSLSLSLFLSHTHRQRCVRKVEMCGVSRLLQGLQGSGRHVPPYPLVRQPPSQSLC